MAQANNDAYWSAIDARIEQAVTQAIEAERERNHLVMAEALARNTADMRKMLDQRLEKAILACDNLATRVTELANGGPDAHGVVRKQVICPN